MIGHVRRFFTIVFFLVFVFNLEFWVLSDRDISIFTIIIRRQFSEELLFGGGLWRSLVLENHDGWIVFIRMDLHTKLSDLFPGDIRNKCFLLVIVLLVFVHLLVVILVCCCRNVNGGPLGVEELVSMILKHDISLQ